MKLSDLESIFLTRAQPLRNESPPEVFGCLRFLAERVLQGVIVEHVRQISDGGGLFFGASEHAFFLCFGSDLDLRRVDVERRDGGAFWSYHQGPSGNVSRVISEKNTVQFDGSYQGCVDIVVSWLPCLMAASCARLDDE